MITNIWYQSKKSFVWDADFLAFWERTTGTPDSWKLAYNNVFLNLKSRGLWSIADCFWLWCGSNESDSRLNLIKNAHNNINNGCSFVNKYAFTGNGISAYLSTNYNPYVDAVNYKLNSATLYVYRSECHTVANAAEISCFNGPPLSEVFDFGASSVVASMNGGASFVGQSSVSTGGISTSRIDASNIISVRGASILNISNSSTGIQNTPIYVLKRNEGGGAYFSDSKLSAGFIGGYITNINTLLDEVVETFLSEIAAL